MGAVSGKVALVTGASRGIGAATARLLAAEGARVVVADITEATDLAGEIGGRFQPLDVTDEAEWTAAVAICEAHEGRLDILVNNAGLLHVASIADTTREMFDAVVAVNQAGPFLGMKAVAPLMQRTGGSMVNISSTAGLRGAPNHVAYVAAKFAVRGMTKVAAIEFAPLNIRVNSIHPGLVQTPMIRPYEEAGSTAAVTRQLVNRVGAPEDVASMVLFLASDAAAYCTGAEFVCDGGIMTGSR